MKSRHAVKQGLRCLHGVVCLKLCFHYSSDGAARQYHGNGAVDSVILAAATEIVLWLANCQPCLPACTHSGDCRYWIFNRSCSRVRPVSGRTRRCCLLSIFVWWRRGRVCVKQGLGKALPNKIPMGRNERTSFIKYLQYISEIEIVIFSHSW